MTTTSEETAVCKNCQMTLEGKPYRFAGTAFHPATKAQCPINFYGGFVCSETCDWEATMKVERPFGAVKPTMEAGRSIKSNWRKRK